jgi:hypothetical protein
MNSLGEPECLDELEFLRTCPELRPALEAGDFRPGECHADDRFRFARPETVDRHQVPGSREVYEYRVQRMTRDGEADRWQAFAKYCPYGRTAMDACHGFLDGGGSFGSRAAAEWAIHLYLAHRHEREVNIVFGFAGVWVPFLALALFGYLRIKEAIADGEFVMFAVTLSAVSLGFFVKEPQINLKKQEMPTYIGLMLAMIVGIITRVALSLGSKFPQLPLNMTVVIWVTVLIVPLAILLNFRLFTTSLRKAEVLRPFTFDVYPASGAGETKFFKALEKAIFNT